MKTVVSGTSASRSPSAYMIMITAMMTQVPTQSAYASSKSHYAFIFLFQNSNHFLHLKFMVYSTHHFLHPTFTVYSNQHFLHPKIIVYSNHSFIFSKCMVIQIIIFFIWNSQFVRIINIFIQYPLFILFSLFLAHLLVSIWIFIFLYMEELAFVRRHSCIL